MPTGDTFILQEKITNVYHIWKWVPMPGLKVSPLRAFVRRLPGVYFLPSEVAEVLEIPLPTLHMWADDPACEARPSAKVLRNGRWIRLYTHEDVLRVRDFRTRSAELARKGVQRGPTKHPKWSMAERAERNRLNGLACHWTRRAQRFREVGMEARALAAEDHARNLRAILRQMAAKRTQERVAGLR